MKLIVVGGGAIGLLTAVELLGHVSELVLLEQGLLGQESSWAGGGIVSPLYPWRYSAPVTALASYAQRIYPELATSLRCEAGLDIELSACGMLMLDTPDERDALAWAARHDETVKLLHRGEIEGLFPSVPAEFVRGIWMPAVANVRNPRLIKALTTYLLKQPKLLVHEQMQVSGLLLEGGRVCGVSLSNGEALYADQIVICGGAWTAQLLSPVGVSIPIKPIQGQMILYKLDPGALPCMLMHQGRYLIPRRDGHVLCGSTLEDVGFDKQTTEEALLDLRASAERLWPALRGVAPIRQWAGLRPASPNGIPFIGEVPNIKGLWVNAGQFRNGLVLAPASARLLADLMLGREPIVDPAPYQLPAA